jgi:hypothetical protein
MLQAGRSRVRKKITLEGCDMVNIRIYAFNLKKWEQGTVSHPKILSLSLHVTLTPMATVDTGKSMK